MKNTNNQCLDERLTDIEFWDYCYDERTPSSLDINNWKELVSIQWLKKVERFHLKKKKVCEVGGGDGKIISYLSKKNPTSEFSIVDFSPLGCDLARKRSVLENVSLKIYQADIFSPPKELVKYFDLVLSHGLVEHFADLSSVLFAKKKLLKDDGILVTLIPNLASPVYSYLCKKWSVSVYEAHVPHDMGSFMTGHKIAGLQPIEYDYFGAIETSILSMAMNGPEHKTWLDHQLYLLLSRLSKFIHLLEYKTFDFPTTRFLSPFMYIASKKKS